jgi:flagellar biosynthesis/type III secretory pathway protein FliH
MHSSSRLIPQELAKQYVTMKLPSLGNVPACDARTGSIAPIKSDSDKEKNNDPVQTAYKKGYSAGYCQAEQDSQALLNARVTQLEPLLKSAQEEVANLKNDNGRKLLDLTMVLAEQIVRAEVKTNTALLMNVIRDSIALVSESASRITIYVHAADADAVRAEISTKDSKIAVAEDNDITQGGCKLVTSQGEIDATLEGRINAVRMALGLEPKLGHQDLEQAFSDNPVV